MVEDKGLLSKIFDVCLAVFLLVMSLLAVYPIIYVVSVSLSSGKYVNSGQVWLLPKGFSTSVYNQVFSNKGFWGAYKNTVVYVVVGTAVNIAFTATMAFALSRRELVFRRFFLLFAVLPMYFHGLIITKFMVVNLLHIYNTMWAIILPFAVNVYNMIIMRTSMGTIPEEVFESMRVDGGNELHMFWFLALPLSKAVMVTVLMFYAVEHWNEYFYSMMFLSDRAKLPVQVILRDMIVSNQLAGMQTSGGGEFEMMVTSEMLLCASLVVVLIPILCVYPYVQRYFIKGVMIGSIKG